MSGSLRSRAKIERALKAAEQAFERFGLIAADLAKRQGEDSDYFRAIEDRAVGHGAIIHILQWVLCQHDDRGIDKVIINYLPEADLSVAKVLHASAHKDLQ